MSQLLSRVGPNPGGDGTTPPLRSVREGDLVVGFGHGRHVEAARRGRLFGVGGRSLSPSQTEVSPPMIGIYNPAGSGKKLAMLRAAFAYQSGTLGGGYQGWYPNNNPSQTVPSGGTLLTAVGSDTSQALTSVAKVRNGGTWDVGTLVRPFMSLGAELVTTANQLAMILEDLEGEFLISPGCSLCVYGITAAGTSPLMAAGFLYEELDL